MEKHKKKNLFWVIFLIMIALAVVVKLWQAHHWNSVFLEINGKKLEVLLAKTYAQQFSGLGKRDGLGIYQGMLFIHSLPDKYGIVMRDMRFPIDIVWLKNGEVIDIAPNVPVELGVPENQLRIYRPRKPANAILELSAGWVEQNGLKIGDKAKVLDKK